MDNNKTSFLNKMQNIEPTSFSEGRASDPAKLRHDLSSYYEEDHEDNHTLATPLEEHVEFSHKSKHTPAVFKRFKKNYRENTDKTPDMAASTFKAFISGIPQGFKEKHLYFNLLVYLSQFELMLVSDLELVDDQTEFTYAVMVYLEATEEALHYLQAHDNTLELDIYSALLLPTTMKLVTTELKLKAYEDAAQHAEYHPKPPQAKRTFSFAQSAKIFED